MKKETVLKKEGWEWVDIENPSESDLESLIQEYGFSEHALKDCLQPDHLPKYEPLGDALFLHFLIVRLVDEKAPETAKTIQELTRKIAIFQGQTLMVTIHRSPMISWDLFKERSKERSQHFPSASVGGITTQILKFVFHSFEPLLNAMEEKVSDMSDQAFSKSMKPLPLEDAHRFTRKISTLRRILRMQIDMLFALDDVDLTEPALLQDAREEGNRVYFFADEVYDALQMTLQTYFSQSSHKTNEVMRVLTLFSAFFMPLTFIVGIYGMNFDFMPELRSPWGYPGVLTVMGLTSVGVYFWARKNGWFEKSEGVEQ